MKLAFQIAYKNVMGAGLRTVLNVGVLSFAFVVIIFYNGLIDGWNRQASRDGIDWEYGNGQLLNAHYQSNDPFTLQDGHGRLPEAEALHLTPVFIQQGAIYPEGRMLSVLIKGIGVDQTVVALPTHLLSDSKADLPALIGKRMAASANLKEGDEVLLRWRDKNGTFDAANLTVAGVFDTNVGTVDQGQIWVSIDQLWRMTGLPGHATYFIANDSFVPQEMEGWKFESREELLKEFSKIIAMKKVSGSIMYLLLLAIALLAIFDTQVLSIFRRQREIGTYIALGMTRQQVVALFTVEGSMYSLLATLVGAAYGAPLFIFLAGKGIGMPLATEDMGVPIAARIFPVFGIGLILGTVLLVVVSATIVSFLPTRKITKMDPVDALKGKLQ